MTDRDLREFDEVWWVRKSESNSLIRRLYVVLLESSDSLESPESIEYSAPLSSNGCAKTEYPRENATCHILHPTH